MENIKELESAIKEYKKMIKAAKKAKNTNIDETIEYGHHHAEIERATYALKDMTLHINCIIEDLK